jgi:hypothetical protein
MRAAHAILQGVGVGVGEVQGAYLDRGAGRRAAAVIRAARIRSID